MFVSVAYMILGVCLVQISFPTFQLLFEHTSFEKKGGFDKSFDKCLK